MELEPVRTEPVIELPAQQAIPTGQDTTRPVIQEPVIQLPPSPTHQEQLELEQPTEAQPEPERPTKAQLEPERPSGNQLEPELQINATRQDQPLASEDISEPSPRT